jgi:hypothetical protein
MKTNSQPARNATLDQAFIESRPSPGPRPRAGARAGPGGQPSARRCPESGERPRTGACLGGGDGAAAGHSGGARGKRVKDNTIL